MPSGFKIVQSTLVKIDGFKLNIDNIESLSKNFNIVSIEFNKKISDSFKERNFFEFQKLNNLRSEN